MGYSCADLNYYRKPPSQPTTSQAHRGETLAGKVVFGRDSGGKEKSVIYLIILLINHFFILLNHYLYEI